MSNTDTTAREFFAARDIDISPPDAFGHKKLRAKGFRTIREIADEFKFKPYSSAATVFHQTFCARPCDVIDFHVNPRLFIDEKIDEAVAARQLSAKQANRLRAALAIFA